MRRDDSHSDLGRIRIHRNVIASISSLAATEIEGVKNVGGDFRSGMMELLGQKAVSAIKVDFDAHDEVKIDIPIVIKYGYNIPDVAQRVQENVRLALEKMTALSVKDVNVNVQGIEK